MTITTNDIGQNARTIGFHPCVGKKASGEARPTTVVIRTSDGKHGVHEFGEQELLDFFTCGAPVGWRDAAIADLDAERPPHHLKWVDAKPADHDAFMPTDPARRDEERDRLFHVHEKKTGAKTYKRAQVPTALVSLDPAADIVGVANGGLGYQVMDILLGRYPHMDVRVVGSGTLKESRSVFDALLPAAIRKKAEKVRHAADPDEAAPAEEAKADEDGDDDGDAPSKSAAKDANAKFDAHRIAYALADEEGRKLFHRCTLRDRDWAGVHIAYLQLETARKARVAAEQQFRQTHRTELRRLVKDTRIPYVILASGEEGGQAVEALLAAYESALRTCDYPARQIVQKLAVLRQAYARIEGAREHEKEMDKHLELALGALPEYTDFLAYAKERVHAETGLPLGKYIGDRIFGRWIAGFGSPMAARLDEPMRPSDVERIAACREALGTAIGALDRSDLPEQPAPGGGKTREWLLACERIATRLVAEATDETRPLRQAQLDQVNACRDAYRRLTNAKKCAAARPLNRVIAYMGLHVRHGGAYEGTKKENEFPRRRKGGRANWNEQLLRQGAYQWAMLIIKGGDSHWKAHVYLPYKEHLVAEGMKKGHAHKRATWRMATNAVRWLVSEWFSWERARRAASNGRANGADRAAA